MRLRDRRGVALILVLWAVVLLGTVAASVGARGSDGATLVVNLRARSMARYAAESGVVAARHRFERLLERNPSTEERVRLFRELDTRIGDLEEVQLGQATFAVVVADLNARLDLNQATEEMLAVFFAQFVDGADARFAAASLEDWKDADDSPRPNGAEADAYRAAGSPYRPANGPLARLEELPRVLGVGDRLARLVAPYVTTNGDSRINLNTAPEAVLAAIPGMGPDDARAWRERLESGELALSSSALLTPRSSSSRPRRDVPLSRTSVVPSRLLIVSRGWQDGHPLSYEVQAVYAVTRDGLRLMDWKERER